MDKKTKQKIFAKREIVKYSAQRAYIGKLTGAGLSGAYGQFKHTQDWDKPITAANVVVGHIDGDVICRALWYEMSYNPARFGKVSPFTYKGREDIYHFCRVGVPENFPGYEIIEKIRHKMIGFMDLNGKSRGQWTDVIDAKSGVVRIHLVEGHSDDMYKVLSLFREMVRIITNQNLEDFKRKNYRTQMLTVIDKRHPNGVRANGAALPQDKPQNTAVLPVSQMEYETEEDKLDRYEESAQITAETSQYRPEPQGAQAVSDLQQIAIMKMNQKTK